MLTTKRNPKRFLNFKSSKSDDNSDGACALALAVKNGRGAPMDQPGVAEKVDQVIEFACDKQLGMPYAEHVARLAVGAAVTWTSRKEFAENGAGTILAILDGGDLLVEVSPSGEQEQFHPGALRPLPEAAPC